MPSTLSKPRSRASGRRDIYRDSTARVLAALERGTAPWRRPWSVAGGQMPRNATTGAPYRGINAFHLLWAGFESPWWMTFKQARALDACVRRGERGTTAVIWRRSRKRLTAGEADERRARGDRVHVDEDGSSYIELVVARTFVVFNAEQVDGLDPSLLPQIEPPTWDPIEKAEAILAGYQGPRLTVGGPRASYSVATDLITMPDRGRFEHATDWYATLWHEAVHSTGHPDRLARDLSGTFGSTTYAREELTAELGAAMLCAIVGIDSPPLIEQQASYLDSWHRALSADPRLLTVAAQRAQRAVDLILGD